MVLFFVYVLADKNSTILLPIVSHVKEGIAQKSKGNIPLIIAIMGCSGVGKSYCAQQLAHLFQKEGIHTVVVKFDDFLDPDYKDLVYFHPAFRYDDAHRFMQSVLKGEQVITKPLWNPKRHQENQPQKIIENLSLKDAQVVICEGEFTLCTDTPYDFKK